MSSKTMLETAADMKIQAERWTSNVLTSVEDSRRSWWHVTFSIFWSQGLGPGRLIWLCSRLIHLWYCFLLQNEDASISIFFLAPIFINEMNGLASLSIENNGKFKTDDLCYCIYYERFKFVSDVHLMILIDSDFQVMSIIRFCTIPFKFPPMINTDIARGSTPKHTYHQISFCSGLDISTGHRLRMKVWGQWYRPN